MLDETLGGVPGPRSAQEASALGIIGPTGRYCKWFLMPHHIGMIYQRTALF